MHKNKIKEVKDLYTENYKSDEKKIKTNRQSVLMDWIN